MLNTGTNETTILPSIQTYPFEIRTPPNVPSSFSGFYGDVTYVIKVRIKRGSWKSDFSTKLPININGLVDLNSWPGLVESVQFQEVRELLGFWYGAGGKAYLRFKLGRDRFVPGESFDFIMEVDYPKKGQMSASLIQEIGYFGDANEASFWGTGSEKRLSESVLYMEGPRLQKGEETKTWRGSYKVPVVPPTGLGGCVTIKVAYRLEVKFETSCGKLKRSYPILIGTIPLLAYAQVLTRPSSAMEAVPISSAPQYVHSDHDVDLLPPNYEAAAHREGLPTYDEIVNQGGAPIYSNFIPKHPAYSLSAT